METSKMNHYLPTLAAIFVLAGLVLATTSCEEDEITGPLPEGDFIFVVQADQATVNATTTSTDNVDFTVWNFGDGTADAILQGSSVNYTYPTSGTYQITMSVINEFGFTTVTQEVTIDRPEIPEPEFILTIDGADPLQVNIRNQSEFVAFYEWDMGDGTVVEWDDPTFARADEVWSYTYAESGFYSVRLTGIGENPDDEERTPRANLLLFAADFLTGGNASQEWALAEDPATDWDAKYPSHYFVTAQRNLPDARLADIDYLDTAPLRPCEADDRYVFTSDGGFENNNGDDGILVEQNNACGTLELTGAQRLASYALDRAGLEEPILSTGNSFIGRSDAPANYRVVDLTANFILLQYEVEAGGVTQYHNIVLERVVL